MFGRHVREGRVSREGAARQLPDHELQVLWGHHAIAVHVKHRKDESQAVLPRRPLAGRHERVHKLLNRHQLGLRRRCGRVTCKSKGFCCPGVSAEVRQVTTHALKLTWLKIWPIRECRGLMLSSGMLKNSSVEMYPCIDISNLQQRHACMHLAYLHIRYLTCISALLHA